MRLLLDECCEVALARALRARGHDVFYVAEALPGATDIEVLRAAEQQDRALVTDDKDFAAHALRQGLPNGGIVLVRMGYAFHWQRSQRVVDVLERYGERLPAHLLVVDSNHIRIRPFRP